MRHRSLMTWFPLLSWCLIIVFGLIWTESCDARDAQNTDFLARKIFAYELEMQKINCYLHLEAAIPSFKRARRTWLWDIGNAVSTESGLIAATTVFWDHSEDKTVLEKNTKVENGRVKTEIRPEHKYNRASGSTIAGTLYPQIVGQAIGGSGALFELSCDVARSVRIRRKRLDGNSVIAKMYALNKEADELLNQFQQTADGKSPDEIRLLIGFKHEILAEFMRLEGQAGQIATGQYIEDVFSLVRNTVGLVGNSINADAVLHNDKILNADGTILNFISASMITIRPLVSNAGAAIVKRRNKQKTRHFFPELNEWKPEGAEQNINLLNSGNAGDVKLQARQSLYLQQLEKFKDERDLAQFEMKQAKQLAVRRYRETIYGPTKMAQSALGLVIGFEHGNNATRDNRLAAIGNTTYTSGQVFNILELTRQRVVDETSHAKRKREMMLPADRIKRQLATVERLQKEAGQLN